MKDIKKDHQPLTHLKKKKKHYQQKHSQSIAGSQNKPYFSEYG